MGAAWPTSGAHGMAGRAGRGVPQSAPTLSPRAAGKLHTGSFCIPKAAATAFGSCVETGCPSRVRGRPTEAPGLPSVSSSDLSSAYRVLVLQISVKLHGFMRFSICCFILQHFEQFK